jgi:hypothetical protein
MKPPDIVVDEVLVSELRKELRERLDFKQPLIIRRNSRVIGILLSVEGGYYGTLENATSQILRLRTELDTVLRRIAGYLPELQSCTTSTIVEPVRDRRGVPLSLRSSTPKSPKP